MKTTITHLPAQVQADLNIITEDLLQQTGAPNRQAQNTARIRYLILHGCFTEDHWQPDTALNPEEDYRYNLLVIVSQNLPDILPTLQDAVEQLNASGKVSFPVSIEADTRGRLNQRLNDGFLLYDHVQTRGIMIYRRGEIKGNPFSLSEPRGTAAHHAQAQEHFDHAFPLAKSFLSSARSLEYKKPDAAAYLLNVAAVQAYATFMAVHTLKYSDRRLINELRGLAESIHPDLKTLWSSPQARSCFDLLKTAFSGPRFSTDYTIMDDQLELMFSYVEDLLEQIKQACEIKLEALKTGSFEKPELSVPESVEEDTLSQLSSLILNMEEPCYELEGIGQVIRNMADDGRDHDRGIYFMGRSVGDHADSMLERFHKMTSLLRKRHIRRKSATQEAVNG